ncbi:TPA: hypothetical protein L1Z92_004855 [Escherichia coli]|nr:hypothetical protein [Escherichia coli]HCK1625772.1 hypothetical protein [Escherichia coli]
MTDELLPEVTATSHPPTPQLTDAACAESLSLLLNPEFEPVTAPAGDTSNQAPHWLVCTVAKRGYSQRTWRNFVQICFFLSADYLATRQKNVMPFFIFTYISIDYN